MYLAREPGSQEYSNGGYLILQMLIEDVTGRPFAEYMRDEVLQPLGMTSSSFVPDEPTKAKLAQWYEVDGNVAGPHTQVIEAAVAGLYTTLDDLVRFTIANLSYHANRTAGVVSLEALQQMRTHPGGFRSMNLGYEFVARLPRFALHGVRFVGHSGGGKGWTTVFAMLPSTGDALVVMHNSSNGIYHQILCTWANVRFGVDCAEEPPPVAIPQSLLDELAGTYRVPDQPDIVLGADNGVLTLLQGERIFSLALSSDPRRFGCCSRPFSHRGARAGRLGSRVEDAGDVHQKVRRRARSLTGPSTRPPRSSSHGMPI